jgi:hypothetical protein
VQARGFVQKCASAWLRTRGSERGHEAEDARAHKCLEKRQWTPPRLGSISLIFVSSRKRTWLALYYMLYPGPDIRLRNSATFYQTLEFCYYICRQNHLSSDLLFAAREEIDLNTFFSEIFSANIENFLHFEKLRRTQL